jgi:hypothetical protein
LTIDHTNAEQARRRLIKRSVLVVFIVGVVAYAGDSANQHLLKYNRDVEYTEDRNQESISFITQDQTKLDLIGELLANLNVIKLDGGEFRLTILGQEDIKDSISSDNSTEASLKELFDIAPAYKSALSKAADTATFWDVVPLIIINDQEKLIPAVLEKSKQRNPDQFDVSELDSEGVDNLNNLLWNFRKFALPKLKRLARERQFISCRRISEYYLYSLQQFHINNYGISQETLGQVNAIYLTALLFQRPTELFYYQRELQASLEAIGALASFSVKYNDDLIDVASDKTAWDVMDLFQNELPFIPYFSDFVAVSFNVNRENATEKSRKLTQFIERYPSFVGDATKIELSMLMFLKVRVGFWRAAGACQPRPSAACRAARAEFEAAYGASRGQVTLNGLDRDITHYRSETVKWR